MIAVAVDQRVLEAVGQRLTVVERLDRRISRRIILGGVERVDVAAVGIDDERAIGQLIGAAILDMRGIGALGVGAGHA